MSLPAITVWAPWGSLMIPGGLKWIETRTHDRFKSLIGETIVIHQGRSRAPLDMVLRMVREVGASRAAAWLVDNAAEAPMGVGLGTARVFLVGWLDDTIETNIAACCRTKDRFGLYLDNLEPFENPIPARGAQGIWSWEGRADVRKAPRV